MSDHTLNTALSKPLGKNTTMAKSLIWAMVATKPDWLVPNNAGTYISVPFDKIDAAFNLDSGCSKAIWEAAQASPEVLATAKLFASTVIPAFPAVPCDPDDCWGGGACFRLYDFIQLLNTKVTPAQVGEVTPQALPAGGVQP